MSYDVSRWKDHGAVHFLNWMDDIQPRVPGYEGGYTPLVLSDRVRTEVARALDGNFHTIVLCWPRRHGKTVIAAALVLHRFLINETQNIAIIANSRDQTVDVCFKLLKTMIQQTPYTRTLLENGDITILGDSIRFPALDNTIQGYPSRAASLYGKKVTIGQISELHAVTGSDEAYQAIASATIDTKGSLVLVDSTAGGYDGPVYKLYDLARTGKDKSIYFSHICYNTVDDAISACPAWIEADKLRSRKAQMLPALFAQQHLNTFTSGSDSLFQKKDLDGCTHEYALAPKTLADGRAYVVAGGLDRAYGFTILGDNTVTTCIVKTIDDEGDDHVYVLASDVIPRASGAGIKKAFLRYHADYGMSAAGIETPNASDIIDWSGTQKWTTEGFNPDSGRQSAAFSSLHSYVTEGRLHIHPKFSHMLMELRAMQYVVKSGGSARFEARRGHDDRVFSLVWALFSLRNQDLNPNEIRGITCRSAPDLPTARLCAMNGGDLLPLCRSECRSAQEALRMWKAYRDRSPDNGMGPESWIRHRLKNTGAHVYPRS